MTDFSRNLRRLILSCNRGATIAEYAVIAALVVVAAGASRSPRLQPVKDKPCCERNLGAAKAGAGTVAPARSGISSRSPAP
jgi:hypothetical protein